MFGRIYALALNTFRDAIRKKILYAIVVMVLGWNLFATVLGAMSWNEEARVARDMGLFGVSAFGSFTAIILGVMLLYTEVQKRTIHTLISKPLARFEFVLGKYLGMVMTLTLLVGLFVLTLAGLLTIQDIPFTSTVAKAALLGYFEVLVVAAIAVFFSSFSSPFLSGVFALGLFLLGRLTPEMRAATEHAEPWVAKCATWALRVVPDLHLFSVSGGTVDGQVVSVHGDHFVNWGYVWTSMGYGAVVIVALLLLAILAFSKRDFV